MTYCVLCRFQLRDPPLNYFVILPFWEISLGRLQIGELYFMKACFRHIKKK